MSYPLPPEAIADAQVVLHLEVEAAAGRREDFLDFCRRAFPDYARGERALEEDTAQAALIKEWRALLAVPPRVSVVRRKIP